MRTYGTIGALAAALRAATADQREIERDVEALLGALFAGWRPRFPQGLGWRFTLPDHIDVYGVMESPAVVDALHRAGFQRVTLHDHGAGERCTCVTHFGGGAGP